MEELQTKVDCLYKEVKRLKEKSKNSLEEIILKGKYIVLTFTGSADNAYLLQSFDNSIILNKKMLIKSFKIIPYAPQKIDELYNDTSGDHYTIDTGIRINKLGERFNRASSISLIINGSNQNFFPDTISVSNFSGLPLNLFVDNIYHLFKTPLESIKIKIDGQVVSDFSNANLAVGRPFVRVLIECYIY